MTKTHPFTTLTFDKSDDHYRLAAHVHLNHRPYLPYSWERTQAADAAKGDDFFQHREFLLAGDRAVGLIEVSDADFVDVPGLMLMDVCLCEDVKGTALSDEAAAFAVALARSKGAQGLFGFAFDKDIRDLELLQRQGFQTVQTQLWTQLDTSAFDPTAFGGLLHSVAERGIRIASLAELTAEGVDWKKRWWELCNQLFLDVPLPEPHKPQPWDEFERFVANDRLFNSPGKFLAFTDAEDLGVAMLFPAETDPAFAYTGLTAVARSARRTGLATALKVTAIGWGKAKGVRTIVADNERNNPMYLLNRKLGFEDAYQEHFMKLTW